MNRKPMALNSESPSWRRVPTLWIPPVVSGSWRMDRWFTAGLGSGIAWRRIILLKVAAPFTEVAEGLHRVDLMGIQAVELLQRVRLTSSRVNLGNLPEALVSPILIDQVWRILTFVLLVHLNQRVFFHVCPIFLERAWFYLGRWH